MSVNYRTQPGFGHGRQRGLSLVELMIALALGAALIGGIIQIFTSNNAAYTLQQNTARMQENARFAFHFLATELRQAGYAGCAGSANHRNMLETSGDKYDYMFNFSKAVEGYDLSEETLPSNIPSLSPAPKADSEVIVIRRSGTGTLTAAENQPNKQAAAFKTAEPHDLEKGQIISISDCQTSYTFQITGSNTNNNNLVANKGNAQTPGNLRKITKSEFSPDWSISRSYAIFYYLVDAANSASGQPALYRQINDQASQELVAGVEDMQLEYGLDTDITFSDPTSSDCPVEDPGGKGDGDVDEYKTAANINDNNCEWAQVIGTRVSVVVRSTSDDVLSKSQTYFFDGNEVTKDDGYMRHAVNSTITFRNKTR